MRKKRWQAGLCMSLMLMSLAIVGVSMVQPTKADGERFSMTLMTNQGNFMRITAMEIIKENLEDVGIDVNLQVVEWPTFVYENILGQDFDTLIVGWIGPIDPDGACHPLFHSSNAELGEFGMAGYNDSEADALMEQGRGEPDINKRQQIYFDLQEKLAEDVPFDFLICPQTVIGFYKGWDGFVPGPQPNSYRSWWSIKNLTANDGSSTFIDASIAAPSMFNSILLTDDASANINDPCFPSLADYSKDLVPQPFLADNWTQGALWYDFKLNNSWTWSDGQPVDAWDFLFTYQCMMNANDDYSISDTPRAGDVVWIDNIEVVSDFEVNITVDASQFPNGYAPGFVDLQYDLIPEHHYNVTTHARSSWVTLDDVKDDMKILFDINDTVVNNLGDAYWTWRWIEDSVNDHPQNTGEGTPIVTCGYWKFVSWDDVLHVVTLETDTNFPLWWQAKDPTVIDTYIYKLGGTMDEISLSLQDGAIDGQDGANNAYAATLEDDPNVQVMVADELTQTFMAFNLRRAPFDDVMVRQAICWAIDKEAIYEAAYYGYGGIGVGPIMRAQGFWFTEENVTSYSPPNPDLAEQMLDDAGWPRAEEDETDWAQIGLIGGIAAAAIIAVVFIYMTKIKGPEE
jgi:ABC-type transport system substrate-binding protein